MKIASTEVDKKSPGTTRHDIVALCSSGPHWGPEVCAIKRFSVHCRFPVVQSLEVKIASAEVDKKSPGTTRHDIVTLCSSGRLWAPGVCAIKIFSVYCSFSVVQSLEVKIASAEVDKKSPGTTRHDIVTLCSFGRFWAFQVVPFR